MYHLLLSLVYYNKWKLNFLMYQPFIISRMEQVVNTKVIKISSIIFVIRNLILGWMQYRTSLPRHTEKTIVVAPLKG